MQPATVSTTRVTVRALPRTKGHARQVCARNDGFVCGRLQCGQDYVADSRGAGLYEAVCSLGIPYPPVPAPQVDSDTFVHERLKDGCSAVSMAYVLRLYNDTFAMTADRLPLRIPW